ncbi:hypothetical protein KC340_g152 [Hortaea werneckii]|nr:hypothetical protein KC340_g152 [Hortaea werneckii]
MDRIHSSSTKRLILVVRPGSTLSPQLSSSSSSLSLTSSSSSIHVRYALATPSGDWSSSASSDTMRMKTLSSIRLNSTDWPQAVAMPSSSSS